LYKYLSTPTVLGGGIAQLVAELLEVLKVEGSNPSESKSKKRHQGKFS
jgi:hypothetical protein